jgi:hypothetical protein
MRECCKIARWYLLMPDANAMAGAMKRKDCKTFFEKSRN